MLLATRSYMVNQAVIQRHRIQLLCIRILFIIAVFIMLLNPCAMRKAPASGQALVAVLIDTSKSMNAGPGTPTRLDRSMQWLSKELDFRTKAKFIYYGFDETLYESQTLEDITARPSQTLMHRCLLQLLDAAKSHRLSAVVLMSDGISPADKELRNSVVRHFKSRRIPVYTIQPVDQLSDIQIDSVTGPANVIETRKASLVARIDSPGFAGISVPMVVRRGDEILAQKQVLLEGQPQDVSIDLPPGIKGEYICTVDIAAPQRDAAPQNNSISFGYNVVEEQISVLYIEGTPNCWMGLKDGLEEDKAFRVRPMYAPQMAGGYESSGRQTYNVVLKHPGTDEKVYHVAHPTGGYPRSMKDLLKYDVIINSDVPKAYFSQTSLTNTARFVEEFGGGFIMIGGTTAFGSGGYNTTAIEKIIPVAMEIEADTVWGIYNLIYKDAIFDHPLMAIGDDKVSAESIWLEKLPSFGGLNTVDHAKPGATLLASSDKYKNQWGPLVVFACQEIGSGRSLAFTADVTQAWGAQFEGKWGEGGQGGNDKRYFKRFWGNAMRWLSAGKVGRNYGEFMLDPVPRVWRQDDRHELAVHVYDEEMRCQPDRQVRISFSNEVNTFQAVCSYDLTRGCYAGSARINVPGNYVVEGIAAHNNGGNMVKRFDLGRITVEQSDIEMQQLRTDEEALRTLAESTGGSYISPDKPGVLAENLIKVEPVSSTGEELSRLWQSWIVLAFVLLLLSAEWIIRRSRSMV